VYKREEGDDDCEVVNERADKAEKGRSTDRILMESDE